VDSKVSPDQEQPQPASIARRYLRLFLGTIALCLVAGFFMSGITPPGIFGEVLRHNQESQIDASPLFYSEVENMQELEEGVRNLRSEAEKQERGQPD